MTPSDQTELRQTCVFCQKIAANDIEAHSDGMVIFTPLNPVVPGHKLFVHTKHTANAAAEPEITGKLFEYAAYYGKGKQFNLITSAGEDATQTVMHTHIHYVPRHKDDGLLLPWSSIAAAEQRTASKAIYGMHDSIMAHKLVLGTETDQAFNYARIHRWIDAEVAELEQSLRKEQE